MTLHIDILPVMLSEDRLYEIIKILRPLTILLSEAVSTELSNKGISVTQRAILELLRDKGSETVANMARILKFKRQYIQGLTNSLFENKYIAKTENPNHIRSTLFVLTPAGKKLIDDILAKEMKNLKKVATLFSKNELQICSEVLIKLKDVFSKEKLWRVKI